jgi:formamidopyrimidine-DNA glycosylase
MPEIKEIRNYANFIRNKVKNKELLEINILKGRYKKHSPFINYNLIKNKLPLKVKDIKTKGKLLYFIFEDDLYLLNTHGLSGGWCYLKNGETNYEFSDVLEYYSNYISKDDINSYMKNALNHLNIEFKTKNGSLFYYDVLSFGTLKVVKGEEELNKKLNKIGPDIMDKNTNFELFKERLLLHKNLDKPIGIVLMDQKVISGIGNYLRSDILYVSKINPFRKVKTLRSEEIKALYKNSKILTWGDYDKDYAKKIKIINKNTKFPADYDRLFFVYGEFEDIHGNNIIKKELYEGSQKRFIYYVPSIQK